MKNRKILMPYPSAALPLPPRRWRNALLCVLGVLLLGWIVLWVVVPRELFPQPCSSLLYDRNGELLGGRIAADGQWRFPMGDSVPEKFVQCLVAYEDKRFFRHPGIDPLAVARALRLNLGARRVVSGGSTITMQLARLARGNRDRTLREKGVEAAWALFLESIYSKREILLLYASHAPFGGNVVGLETAAWRYFGRSAADLSWAESAVLAVLPNAPALIHPGRNRTLLLAKRNRLLAVLRDRGILDPTEYELACLEPLPAAPLPLPDEAPHLLTRLAADRPGERIGSSLEASLQRRVQTIVNRYAREYAASNHVHNLAALVADVRTGEVLAYAGNATFEAPPERGNDVDIITARRSTGSVLKPMLYAAMLHEGMILPGTLVVDTPLDIDGFAPQNYNRTFNGVIPARVAIERSLNVPLVRMLSQYNTGRFLALLRRWGMATLDRSEAHYGASLILGGAEGTLWDMAGMYASMARVLNHFGPYNGRYDRSDIHSLTPYPLSAGAPIRSVADPRLTDQPELSAAAIWFAFEAMSGLNRPEEEADWQQFASMKRVAWKTGTSYGGRDAWAIGLTPRYVVGVWAGNASGEGRPGLTGVGNAAPVLFDLFSLLPESGWFEKPVDELEPMPICRTSGHRASALCPEVDTLDMPRSGALTPLCPYHIRVHLSPDGRYRVNSSCESVERMITRSWFVLPPAQEYYYRRSHLDYLPLPPYHPDCQGVDTRAIEVIYPEQGAVLHLPKGFSGERERFVFRAAAADQETTLYWYLDQEYLGTTRGEHQMACEVAPGHHLLSLTDDDGNRRGVSFVVR